MIDVFSSAALALKLSCDLWRLWAVVAPAMGPSDAEVCGHGEIVVALFVAGRRLQIILHNIQIHHK
jgi:hypothetical protein